VASKLGVRSIAEFVEDAATREQLRQVGIDFVQGFGVARPEPLWAAATRLVETAGT